MATNLHDARPCAFLFAAPLQNEEEGETIDEALLSALRAADPLELTDSRVFRGGLLLAELSYKPSSIKAGPTASRNTGGAPGFQTQQVEHSDSALYATLAGDFVQACLERWNTVVPNTFWNYVANRSLTAAFLPSLTPGVAADVDQHLRTHPHYVGAVSPDMGNPLHRYLFVEVMFKDSFIRNGRVHLRSGSEGDFNGSFLGADTFSPLGMAVLSYEEFEKEAPPIRPAGSLSERGLVTQMRMRGRMALDVHQNVMSALSQSPSLRDIGRAFEWDLMQLPDSPEEVQVNAKKLTDYLLALDHEKGGSKAKFFEKQLAITREDWAYLHGQIVDGLNSVPYADVKLDEHGIRFSACLPVTGRNGATATIETGWIIRVGERASFVTAFPAKKDAALESRAVSPRVVPKNLEGDSRWDAIYTFAVRAGRKAMRDFVPKPLVVAGQVYMDGECGGAHVVIEDGRTSFARWLRRKGLNRLHHQRGYLISAEQIGQSAESAKAYADAFALVLRRNRIKCRSEIYLT
ncbi:MAG: hypothetical protein JWR22_3133 [Herminiimonas sp.]|nr:hypothetical protein [Herminiimonas sp.]